MMERKRKTSDRLRLDVALVQRGLVSSREKAQALIMAGQVRLEGQVADKADRPVAAGQRLEIAANPPYVSRGGFKLERALERFAVSVDGLTILDVGISTGGFSDCLLQRGARCVVGVDVNVVQVDGRLRADPRLRLVRKNARLLTPADLPEQPDLIVGDLSFISLAKVLPALAAFAPARLLLLVKPQFEAERGRVGKGGVVRDPRRRAEILLALKHRAEEAGYSLLGFCAAGVRGKKGNQEYFFLLQVGGGLSIHDTMIADSDEI